MQITNAECVGAFAQYNMRQEYFVVRYEIQGNYLSVCFCLSCDSLSVCQHTHARTHARTHTHAHTHTHTRE